MDYEAGTSSSAVAAVAEVQTTGIEALMGKVGSLMNEIKANLDNPNPVLLHALSAILESQKLRYMKEIENSFTNISWRSHDVGKIMNMIREDHDLFSLISSKFLDDSTYCIPAVAATARLVFSCSTTSSFEHGLTVDVRDNIMRWVHDANPMKKLEYDILHTYSIGLLAICLDCDGPLVETVPTSELTSKLMRYLCKGVLGDNKETSKKEDNSLKNGLKNCNFASEQITHFVNASVRVAEAEARAANASTAAIRRAGEAAVEFIKTAVCEVYRKTKDKEAAVLAASRAASNVKDAADAVALSRILNAGVPEICENPDEFFLLTSDSLVKLREKFCIQCLMALGVEDRAGRPLLRPKGVSVCIELLKTCHEKEHILPGILKLLSILVPNKKFAELFLERGGIYSLLAVPRNEKTYADLSSCLFIFCSVGRIMERVCALPEDIIHEVIALVLEFLECQEDKARQNAASFLALSFVYRAVIDAFDAHDGLRRLLHHLHIASTEASALPGLPNSFESILIAAKVLTPRIVYQTCHALRQYMRAHLLFVIPLAKSSSRAPWNISNVRKGNKPLDLSDKALDAVFHRIHKDPELVPTFVRARWPVVDRFLSSDGHVTLFKLSQVSPLMDFPCEDLLQSIFGVLHIVTLVPYSRKLIMNMSQRNGRLIDIIFDSIGKPEPLDDRVVEPALQLLANLVSPLPPVSYRPNVVVPRQQPCSTQTGLTAKMEQVFHEALDDIRACTGLRVLLGLLQPGRKFKFQYPLWRIQLFTCRVLLCLARDNTIAHLLTQLQFGKKLMELDFETATSSNDVWQAELFQSAAELIAVLTTGSRSTSAVAIDDATPIWRRIKRDGIAEGSFIHYNNSELLQLINKHLFDAGLTEAANVLKAQLTSSQASENKSLHAWPCGRSPSGVFPDKSIASSSHKIAPRSSNLKIKLKDRSGQSKGKTPIVLPMKRKSKDSNEISKAPSSSSVETFENGLVANDLKPCSSENVTLDSIVTQYLKQRHQQCQHPITTLPPLSLLHPHVCAETRFSTRESRGNDRWFIYSRFRLKRTVRDPVKPFFTCLSFLGESPMFAAGCYARKLKVFDYTKGNCIASSRKCHGLRPSLVQSYFLGKTRLLLSSSPDEVCLWRGTSLLDGPAKTYEGITGARFSNCGTRFGAVQSQSASPPSFEVLLFDVETSQLRMKLNDEECVLTPSGRAFSQIHFNPLVESMVLFNGILWDWRARKPIHHFVEFSDYGGGGFHPVRNEVIINSEVWDIRNFNKLLHGAPSLNRTEITFNPTGDIIYAILRRNRNDVESAFDASRKEHSLFSAFLTVDTVNYSEIARIPVEGGVLDLAVEPSDSFVGVVAMDDAAEMRSSARMYEIGRKRPSDGDSDSDDVEMSEKKGRPRRIPVRHVNPSTGDSDSSEESSDDDDDDGNVGGDNSGNDGDNEEYEYNEDDGDIVLGPDGHLYFADELMNNSA